jgi:hypothetical protein
MKKSVFQKISTQDKTDRLGHAFYKIRHYSNAKLSAEELEMMRDNAYKFIADRDKLNNEDYNLVCRLFNLRNERIFAEKMSAAGKKSSANMTPEQRSARAKKAVAARITKYGQNKLK